MKTLALLAFLLCQPFLFSAEVDFGAYYTEIKSGQDWERYSRTGPFADVVVRVGAMGGSLIFWRGNSYLPYWQTDKGRWNLPEIISRSGDGSEPMPDRNNVYSHVEVIKNNPDEVIVLWRYLASFTAGNPHGNVKLDNFVEETFDVTPDGKVRRLIKRATEYIDDWNDPQNQIDQELQLKPDGIAEISKKGPDHSPPTTAASKNPIQMVTPNPVLRFPFDEGLGTGTAEVATRTIMPILGPKALWKKGVSGSALEFDGYHSVVVLPADKAPKIACDGLTLEGWIALGAYPWNWAPIVQQGDNKGYFLGVDAHGYPGFMIEVGGAWEQLTVPNQEPYTDDNHLALFHWYHIAGTYNQQDGAMRLYVDGKEVASKIIGTSGLQLANADIRIGKAGILRTPTEGTHDTKPSDFGFDGLIDEVRIYDHGLDASQVAKSFETSNPGPAIVNSPDMERRKLPTFDTGGKFGAVYTRLPYYETWDNLWSAGPYSDLVVGFDNNPTKFIFWRGASYIPMLVNESNQWYMNEFNETGFNKDARGDYEPMSDKACFDSHVRLIENTPARVVVHWRYRLADPDHRWAYFNAETGWGDIADWYYYIYPDGVACKHMRCYSSRPDTWHEWDEQIVVFGEGQHPESVINKTPVMTLVDNDGKALDYDWNPNPPKPAYEGKIIQMIHLLGRYSPFTIQNFNKGDIYRGERTWYSVFPSWNHWPTSQIDSSGRNASFPDRAAHSSISHLFWPFSYQQKGDISFQEKTLMEGMTDQPADSLVDLAKSWLHAPPVTSTTGGKSLGYDQNQRAYVFQSEGGALSLRINASQDQPIHHVCFLIKNWESRSKLATVKINGAEPLNQDFRQGTTIDTDGSIDLVIWIGLETHDPTVFEIN